MEPLSFSHFYIEQDEDIGKDTVSVPESLEVNAKTPQKPYDQDMEMDSYKFQDRVDVLNRIVSIVGDTQ